MKKSLVNKVLLGLMVSSNVIWGGTTVHAEEPQQFMLDEIIVTATRTEKPLLDTPANVQVITAKEITDGGYMSAYEAVKSLAQANASSYQEDGTDWSTSGMSSRIKLRGLDSGTLILINGIPSNYMNYGTLNNIPKDQIERIEIVKGSGSVLYGAQAMGGVINIITKKPGAREYAKGNVYGTIGSRYKDAGLNIYGDYFDLGLKKSFSKDRYAIQRVADAGNGNNINIKGKKNDQMYLDIALAKDLTFSYGRTHNKFQYEVLGYKNHALSSHYETNGESVFNNYGLVYDNKESGLKIITGYNDMDYKTVYNKSLMTKYTDNNFSGYNFIFDVQKKVKLRNGKDSLVVGADYNRENMEYVYGALDGENNRNGYSLYQSYDYQVNEKLNFIFGLREYYVSKSKYQDSDFQLLPQLQGAYKINNNSTYYFNVGKAFEMPQIGSGFEYANSGFVVNPDLKPQSSWAYEMGYKYEDSLRAFSADVFYMDVTDKFASAKLSTGESITINRDKWKNIGLELNYKQKLSEDLSANVGVTLQNPKSKTAAGSWLQDEAKCILNIGTQYNKSKFIADARLFAYLGRESAYYKYDGSIASGKPDHNLANSCDLTLTLSYKPTNIDTIRLIGRNLLNREDAFNKYEYIAAPINYTLTYERSF